MQSADPDAKSGALVPRLEAANDDTLSISAGAAGPATPASSGATPGTGSAARGLGNSGNPGAPTPGSASDASGAAWDPFEIWRTRIRDARRAASEPRDD